MLYAFLSLKLCIDPCSSSSCQPCQQSDRIEHGSGKDTHQLQQQDLLESSIRQQMDCENLLPKDCDCAVIQNGVTQVSGICDQIVNLCEVLALFDQNESALFAVLRLPSCTSGLESLISSSRCFLCRSTSRRKVEDEFLETKLRSAESSDVERCLRRAELAVNLSGYQISELFNYLEFIGQQNGSCNLFLFNHQIKSQCLE